MSCVYVYLLINLFFTDDPSEFWGKIAKEFHWKVEPIKEDFLKYNFNVNDGPIKIEWMKGAKLNICYNTLGKNYDQFVLNSSRFRQAEVVQFHETKVLSNKTIYK